MQTKTESRILLTALFTAPIVFGIAGVVSGVLVPFSVFSIIAGLLLLALIWQPWRWFQKKK